jgi:hypothetical protein
MSMAASDLPCGSYGCIDAFLRSLLGVARHSYLTVGKEVEVGEMIVSVPSSLLRHTLKVVHVASQGKHKQ